MQKLVKSLLVLLLVSLGLSLPFSHSVVEGVKYFIFFSILQVVAYNLYQYTVSYFNGKLLNERIREYSKQGIETNCPCHKNIKVFLPIRLDRDNSYKCLECSKNVAVKLEVKTFMTTEAIDLDSTDERLIEAVKKIKDLAE